jgi:hypothetical protein
MVQRHHSDLGDIEAIELLEKGKETSIRREYIEIFHLWQAGLFNQVSKMPM